MITPETTGSFDKTITFLEDMRDGRPFKNLDRYGRQGADALSSATPRDSGETAESWGYTVLNKGGRYSIIWYNTHREDEVNVAVILQYGHGTGTGGWVEGIDYINPAMRPLFEKMINDIWMEVRHA